MRKIAVWILVIALALYGVIMLSSATESGNADKEPVSLSDISYTQIQKDDICYIEDLLVVDRFAVKEASDVQYLLVMFQDKNERTVAAIMPINKDSDIWDAVMDYLEDDTKTIGDLAFHCYVKAEANTDVDGKLHDYFDEAVETVQESLGYSALISKLHVRLKYVCDENGDPMKTDQGVQTIEMIMGILAIGAMACIAVAAIVKPAKVKAADRVQPVPNAPVQSTKPSADSYQSDKRSSSQQIHSEADSVMEKLDRYQALKNAGYITEEEFEKKRKELLDL